MESIQCSFCPEKAITLLKWLLECNAKHEKASGNKESLYSFIQQHKHILDPFAKNAADETNTADNQNDNVKTENDSELHQGQTFVPTGSLIEDWKGSNDPENSGADFSSHAQHITPEDEPHISHETPLNDECPNQRSTYGITQAADSKNWDVPLISENQDDIFEDFLRTCTTGFEAACGDKVDFHDDYTEYPRRIRKSKYYHLQGNLSHIRRDPKCVKRKENDRSDSEAKECKYVKREVSSTMESPLIKRSESCHDNTEKSENVLIVKELMKYLFNPTSRDHQNFALTILKTDETLMRIFLEEKKKLKTKMIPVFKSCSIHKK